jgi:hypothetical protein
MRLQDAGSFAASEGRCRVTRCLFTDVGTRLLDWSKCSELPRHVLAHGP